MTGSELVSPPISIAGRAVTNPVADIARYLTQHCNTVARYDMLAGTVSSVDPQVISATRRPWMNSRISAREGDWFIAHAPCAPWYLVPRGAELRDADPIKANGLYDNAEQLYDYFRKAAPKGVSVAKVSKVLHLMRPHFFPILDRRLMRFYSSASADAARRIAAMRPELARSRRLYWAAIRHDIIENRSALAGLRTTLRQSQSPLSTEVASYVGDVRLLDMLAWAAPTEARM